MYDYVVVGGGSAGRAVAGRLAMSNAGRVLILEAGGNDNNPLIHIPAGFTKLLSTDLLYHYKTEKQPGLNGKERILPQGNVIGGGSSVNAAIYIRGQRGDYDGWAEDGAEGWSYREVLPYFMRAEDNNRLSGDYHGTGGPLGVSDVGHVNELTRAFVLACQQKGIPFTPDFNGRRQRGAGFNQTTARNGKRCSAAVGYARPAQKTGRLDIETGCLVTRVLFEGDKAVGVEYRQNGQLKTVHCEREVILSRGRHPDTEAADAFGHRPRGATAQPRHCDQKQKRGRRTEFAGSPGISSDPALHRTLRLLRAGHLAQYRQERTSISALQDRPGDVERHGGLLLRQCRRP